jgi:FixJ family two-component response regulator
MEYPQPSVVDFVQMKMDYQGWYHLQSPRDQQIIDDLSMGCTTGEVAKKFGVSDGLISIKRKNFANSWREYQAVA